MPYGTTSSFLPYSMYIQVYVQGVYPDVLGVYTYAAIATCQHEGTSPTHYGRITLSV